MLAVHTCKSVGLITYRNFKTDEARKCKTPTVAICTAKVLIFCRVSRLGIAGGHDLHRFQGAAIPVYPGIYHLQELDYYHHRLWRGAVVWRQRHASDAVLLRAYRPQLRYRCLGRHPARPRDAWPRKQRSIGADLDAQRRLHVDDDQLLLHHRLRARHAQAHQADWLQGL